MSAVSAKENLTPLMKQYEDLKAQYLEEILLFRLGDFYEIFSDDAKKAAPILEVALTQRQGVPMCGVPHHAVARYMAKLLKKRLRVAVAEQMEDPAAAKGIVKRQVVRVISPGTLLEDALLQAQNNNFLVAVSIENKPSQAAYRAGLAALDISTGQFFATEMEDDAQFSRLANEIALINPAEIIAEGDIPATVAPEIPVRLLKDIAGDLTDLAALASRPLARQAAHLAAAYARKMNPGAASMFEAPQWLDASQTLSLDRVTLENLEILRNKESDSTDNTLLEFLDQTVTAMGGRLLKQWLLRPLKNIDGITARHDAVEDLVRNSSLRTEARECLKGALDMERILARAQSGQANPRDVLGLKNSLEKVQALSGLLRGASALLHQKAIEIPDFQSFIVHLASAISEDPPIRLENTGAIRDGFNAALDEKRSASREGKNWMAALEARVKEATKISTLKISYTSVFGYYYEVSKSHVSKVPPEWHRKQTLVNAERFIDNELKDLEQKILGAEEQALRMERALFREILESISERASHIRQAARAAAELDCLLALAETADMKSLARPQMDETAVLELEGAWHPVVKDKIAAGMFVPNDCSLSPEGDQIIILTGPNMSGKSTYLRQTALAVLMAQAGSFVPAKKARIGIVDAILTRIGSGDRLAQGESTFMVEMKETAKILREATGRSLVILDEVGRGTSTYDGISIAWAVLEHLNRAPKPKVLFATHYFELTHLASELDGVKNFNVQAQERNDTVVFMHKIVPGPADRSYGIHVAKIAGMPGPVVERAKKILARLENEHDSLLKSRKSVQQELAL
ncbi:MAG: DNA mismatch repair protein MutS [Elusimicrobia bacterium RIFCSPLOWO2_01_FULL_54_10]|nr:MAG: DNA mismatch repair protein MutS [Elusimicrobia bacterium RIFCSPLOWO2_01_FULL_54_10]